MNLYQKIENRNVLVTGGAGFIGSNLCEDLLKYGNKVVCLDNFSTGNFQNIESFLDHPNFSLIEADIRDFEVCLKASKNIDVILHQAALGSVPRSIKDPIATNSANVTGFLNMLTAAKENGVKRFIYAASSSTYGDSQGIPKVEDQIGSPLSPYAVSKYVNELYAHVYGLNYGLDCIGLRYFNVFGRRQDPNGAYAAVIPKFINLLLKGESPTINGDGMNSRDFTFIENVIQMNHLAATTTNKRAIGQVFNTAVGEQTSLLELVSMIKEELTHYHEHVSDIELKFGSRRLGDVEHSLASIEKAKSYLNYVPTHKIQEGLKETVHWFVNCNNSQ